MENPYCSCKLTHNTQGCQQRCLSPLGEERGEIGERRDRRDQREERGERGERRERLCQRREERGEERREGREERGKRGERRGGGREQSSAMECQFVRLTHVPRNSKSGHQAHEKQLGGKLSLSFRVRMHRRPPLAPALCRAYTEKPQAMTERASTGPPTCENAPPRAVRGCDEAFAPISIP